MSSAGLELYLGEAKRLSGDWANELDPGVSVASSEWAVLTPDSTFEIDLTEARAPTFGGTTTTFWPVKDTGAEGVVTLLNTITTDETPAQTLQGVMHIFIKEPS